MSFEDISSLKINELDSYIEKLEKSEGDVKPKQEKIIFWNNNEIKKTEYSIVYLHGLNACRQELEPVPSEVAKKLGSNIFFARMKGHGVHSNDKIGYTNYKDWVNDAYEAYEIGKKIGEKVILIGTSTGATAVSFLLIDIDIDIYKSILISPNFGPFDKSTTILTYPLSKLYVPMILGKYYKWQPQNTLHGVYWKSEYHSHGLITMMNLVKKSRKLNYKNIKNPVLFMFSDNDKTVDHKFTKQIINKIPEKFVQVKKIEKASDKQNHVLAGDVLSPENNSLFIEIIFEYILKD